MMDDLAMESYIKSQESGHVTEMKQSHYEVHPPGEYVSQPPYRDYPVVEATHGMVGTIVNTWVERLDFDVERVDDIAWAVYVPLDS
jgi:hypothetical protein